MQSNEYILYIISVSFFMAMLFRLITPKHENSHSTVIHPSHITHHNSNPHDLQSSEVSVVNLRVPWYLTPGAK